MTPEVALLLAVLVVGGPLFLWLGYHAREEGTSEDVILGGGFWVCPQCRSVNLANRSKCYACRADRASARRPSPGPATGPVTARTRAPVPVMASDLRPGARDPALAAMQAPAPEAVTGYVGARLGSSRGPAPAPVLAAGAASVSAASPADAQPARPGPTPLPPATVAPLPPATPVVSAGPPAAPVAARRPSAVPAASASARVAVAVCPYVRVAGDPATWHAFPCDANLCHARSAAGPAASGLGRLVPGRINARGPQPIPPDTQQRLCLDACPRDLQAVCRRNGRHVRAGAPRRPDGPGWTLLEGTPGRAPLKHRWYTAPPQGRLAQLVRAHA